MHPLPFLENYSLQNLNTFGIAAKAKKFVEVSDIQQLTSILSDSSAQDENLLILGGGSNILFIQDYDGLVIKNGIKGINILNDTGTELLIKAGAGENWHDLVLYSINQGFGGIENLSLIPGTVGAAPMQNIGAYGVEIKDVFESLEALNIETLKIETFDKDACKFGYRQSIFKNIHKGKYIIVSVTLKLSKKPILNTSYGAIQDTLKSNNVTNPGIKDVSDAVISIRQSKLPNPQEIGNAGSFFKNPVLDQRKYDHLKNSFPTIPCYQLPDDTVKIPAAWLIETCGWRGKRIGNIGVHDKQALVLVNHGNGNGKDLEKLALDIQASVKEKFEIDLDMEVNLV